MQITKLSSCRFGLQCQNFGQVENLFLKILTSTKASLNWKAFATKASHNFCFFENFLRKSVQVNLPAPLLKIFAAK